MDVEELDEDKDGLGIFRRKLYRGQMLQEDLPVEGIRSRHPGSAIPENCAQVE